MDVKKVTAYQCPYCGYYALDESDVQKHANTCRNNPDFTQECLYCHCLEKDFEHRILFPKPNASYCCQMHGGGSCIYKSHTNTALMEHIEKKKTELAAYGIVENENGALVWNDTKGTS